MPKAAPTIRRVRPGFVLVAIVVMITLAMGLYGLWAKAAIAQHRSLDGEALRMQAERLAESGVARAIDRHAADPDYSGETWSIRVEELYGRGPAEVRIRVQTTGDEYHVSVTADFPAGTVRRARVTKDIDIISPTPGEAS
jgi:hypothetical protein